MTIVERLKTFIENDLMDQPVHLTAETPLFSSNLLDSLALLDLLSFLEEEFSIKVRAEDVQMENLDTIGFIAQLITTKTTKHV